MIHIMKMSKTKEQIIAQVGNNTKAIKSLNYKIEDINAFWHIFNCLEKDINKLKERQKQLHEMYTKQNNK